VTAVVEVRFKGNRREFFSWTGAEPPAVGDPVVVEVERGQDLGHIGAIGDVAERKCLRGCDGCSVTDAVRQRAQRRVIRRAGPDDLRAADGLRRQEDDVRRKVRERVREHGLPMKVSDAEWQWDRRKLTIYFTADQRVDFRALVRDLASLFRARIELRQIGLRDEARRLDGIGRCGRQLCIASWLPEGRPVSLSLAKDQGLSLNPIQISGPCGRLLCCLHYEHEFYVQARRRFPKEGKILQLSAGPVRVLAVDIFRERVTVRAESGDTKTLPLADLRQDVERAGAALVSEPRPAPPPLPPQSDPGTPRGSGRRRRRGA
jgi:cell fate regulator YaaT (PSP1 superfamily)